MSSSANLETLYHLTANGWVRDECPDRVESWSRVIRPDGTKTWRCDWVDRKKLASERDALRARYQAFMLAMA